MRRRYEILLPLQFNDGQAVPNELIVQTLLDLENRFGAVSAEAQVIRGIWHHQDTVFRDESTRIFADVPDTPENRQFFLDFKEILKTRFQQLDIWIATHPIEML